MATISKKNPMLLASDFVKNYKQYESYLKHCLNILKTQNWLKEHQFDDSVSDYDYMSEFMYKNGIVPWVLFALNKKFKEDVIDKLPQEQIHKVKTNRYFCDGLFNAMKMFSELNDVIANALEGEYKNLPDKRKSKEDNRFTRQFYNVLLNGIALEDREYSERELIELIINGKLLIVSSDVERVGISEQELIDGINSGKIDFQNRDFTGGFIFESNTGDTMELFESQNEDDRKKWFAKNMLLLRYIRSRQMTFDRQDKTTYLACNKSFDATYDHIDTITSEVARNFTRRKKKIPAQYISLADRVKKESAEQKQIFDTMQTKQNFDIIDVDFEAD